MGSEYTSAIGIDLGTTYSCAAVYQKGKVTIIANDEGNRRTASCVAFTDTERLIGDAAKSQAILNPENTIFDMKRMIGRKFNDPKIQQDIENWQFKVASKDLKPKIRAQDQGKTKTFTPEEIVAMVLTKMKQSAESYLGKKVTDAVISVPACFNDAQRLATLNSARIAGLHVIRLITEPTAAALAYRAHRTFIGTNSIYRVLIFDLGGGTLDVSVVNVIDDWKLVVRSTAGDSHLGGEDFDNVLVAHFVEEFKTQHQRDLRTCPKALRRLRIACEEAKRTLSSCFEARIDLSSLLMGIDFHSKLTRAQFEDMCMGLFRSALKPVERALSNAIIDKRFIHEVVLVGGSTRIPKIRQLLTDFFDGKELFMSVNPDEAVACGAAVQAAVLHGRSVKNIDLNEIYSLILIDVAPFYLWMSASEGVTDIFIKRNSWTPCRVSRVLSTDFDNQTHIDFLVFEGERAVADESHVLGRFRINGIPPGPKKTPRIKLWFLLDMNGILSVSAEKQGIAVVNHKDGLSTEEVGRIANEIRVWEREDKIQRDRKLARNELESYVYSVKESVECSSNDGFSEMDKKVVIALSESLIEWMDANPSAEKEEIHLKMFEARRLLNPFMMQAEEARSRQPDLAANQAPFIEEVE